MTHLSLLKQCILSNFGKRKIRNFFNNRYALLAKGKDLAHGYYRSMRVRLLCVGYVSKEISHQCTVSQYACTVIKRRIRQ